MSPVISGRSVRGKLRSITFNSSEDLHVIEAALEGAVSARILTQDV